MQAFNVDVQDRIPALVKSILEQAAIATELTPESLLVDVGLTLMDMVNAPGSEGCRAAAGFLQERSPVSFLNSRCHRSFAGGM
jgi:hypothetical protein